MTIACMILLEQPLVLMPAHRQRMKYKKYYRWRRLPTMARYILLCYILLPLSLFLKPTQAREADDRSRFLYADDPDAIVILEYQLHNAPSRDYTGDEQKKAAKEQPGSEYDEEKHIKPYFLQPDNGPRVVQYYSPWCG